MASEDDDIQALVESPEHEPNLDLHIPGLGPGGQGQGMMVGAEQQQLPINTALPEQQVAPLNPLADQLPQPPPPSIPHPAPLLGGQGQDMIVGGLGGAAQQLLPIIVALPAQQVAPPLNPIADRLQGAEHQQLPTAQQVAALPAQQVPPPPNPIAEQLQQPSPNPPQDIVPFVVESELQKNLPWLPENIPNPPVGLSQHEPIYLLKRSLQDSDRLRITLSAPIIRNALPRLFTQPEVNTIYAGRLQGRRGLTVTISVITPNYISVGTAIIQFNLAYQCYFNNMWWNTQQNNNVKAYLLGLWDQMAVDKDHDIESPERPMHIWFYHDNGPAFIIQV